MPRRERLLIEERALNARVIQVPSMVPSSRPSYNNAFDADCREAIGETESNYVHPSCACLEAQGVLIYDEEFR